MPRASRIFIGTILPLSEEATLAQIQAAFRFRNDDGTEITATWVAVENTNITEAASVRRRLRILINATGDPDAGQYQLEYKLASDPDSSYRKIN